MLKRFLSQANTKINKAFNQFVASVFLATQLLFPLALTSPVQATQPQDNPNHPDYWCGADFDGGVKFDDDTVLQAGTNEIDPITIFITVDGENELDEVTSVSGEGVTPTKVIVNGANQDNPYDLPGDQPPYTTPTGQEISHVIVCYDEADQVNYCDPSQKPGGTSIDNWVPKDVDCVVPDVELECGIFDGNITSEVLGPWGQNYGIAWSEGSADYSTPFSGLPASFPEDYSDGSIDIYWFIVGPEAGYVQGHGFPNFWDQNAEKVTVDTDCKDQKSETGDIKVKKFEDKNENGQRDDGEELVDDWDMFLYNANWDEIDDLDTEDDDWVKFENLDPGTYYVCEETEPDWTQTYPDSTTTGAIQNQSEEFGDGEEEEWCWEVELEGGDVVRLKFGNHEDEDGGGGNGDGKDDITVKKFQDDDGDGQRDGGEDFLPNWLIRLYDDTETLIDSELTDSNGAVTFADLADGNYIVCEVMQSGWQQTAPTGGEPAISQDEGEICFDIILRGQDFVCEFGNLPPQPHLRINKFNDATDALLPGATVTYTISVINPEGASPVFDAEVGDVLPAGFTFNGNYSVTSTERGDITAQAAPAYDADNFGTWQIGDLVPGETVDIVYQVVIGDDVPAGTYENVAFVEACKFDKAECEDVILGEDVTPEEDNDVFAESSVSVAAVLGEAVAVLAETGVPAILSPLMGFGLIGLAAAGNSGAILRRLRRLVQRFSHGLALSVMTLGLLAMSYVPALAASGSFWTLRVADLANTTTASTLQLSYSIGSTDENNAFTVNIDINGPGSNDAGVTVMKSGSFSQDFDINLPVDGSYDIAVSATGAGSAIGDTSVAQTVTRDSTVPAAPGQASVTQNNGQWTITFTVPSGSDAETVLIFASTNSSFTTDDSTQVGEVAATPGTEQTFVYGAPDAQQRYFALQTVDEAGNRNTLTPSSVAVADANGGVVAADAGVVDDGAATDDQTADDTEGQEQGATTEEDDGGNSALVIIGLAAVAAALYYVFGRRPSIEE